MKSFLYRLIIPVFFLSGFLSGCQPRQEGAAYGAAAMLPTEVGASPPNFLFILADDLTHWDIGTYGSETVKTPNIDRLAAEGMQFTRAFTVAPMCSPARHCLYTGLYPVKSGAYPNHAFAQAGTQSIVHYLEALGYRVGLAGKLHVAPEESFPFTYIPYKNGEKGVLDFEEIRKFMEKDPAQPFCLFVCSNEPHAPWDRGDASAYDPETFSLPPYWIDTEETRIALRHYYAEVSFLDSQVGQCLNLLDEGGLTANTLTMFSSEQGSQFPFAKWTCYEAGLHTGLIARWPGHIAPNSRCDALVEYVDLVPTLVELAGGHPSPSLDGKSMAGLFSAPERLHKPYVFGIQTSRGIHAGPEAFGIRSVRGDRYKYILNLFPENRFTNVVSELSDRQANVYWASWLAAAQQSDTARLILQRFHYRPAEELYDLESDPFERQNLADSAAFREVKSKLSEALLAWMASQGDLGRQTEEEALLHQEK